MKAQYIEIDEYGNKTYYSDKEMEILHREDGPAFEHISGNKEWWKNGELHREDGPAVVVFGNGYEAWYLNGIEYSQKDHCKTILKELKKKIENLETLISRK